MWASWGLWECREASLTFPLKHNVPPSVGRRPRLLPTALKRRQERFSMEMALEEQSLVWVSSFLLLGDGGGSWARAVTDPGPGSHRWPYASSLPAIECSFPWYLRYYYPIWVFRSISGNARSPLKSICIFLTSCRCFPPCYGNKVKCLQSTDFR